MKLNLPHKLRRALLACICSAATLGTTLSSGTIAAGAATVVFATAGQAMAEDITINAESDTNADTEGVQAADIVVAENDSTSVTLEVDAGVGSLTVGSGATATISSAAVAEGADPYTLTASSVSNAGTLNVNANTTVTQYDISQAGKVSVANGAALTINGITKTYDWGQTLDWWNILTAWDAEAGDTGLIAIKQDINTNGGNVGANKTISGRYDVSGSVTIGAWNNAWKTTLDSDAYLRASSLNLWHQQTLEVAGTLTVDGQLTIGREGTAAYLTINDAGAVVTAGSLYFDNSTASTVTMTAGQLSLNGAVTAHTSGTINLGGGKLSLNGGSVASNVGIVLQGSAEIYGTSDHYLLGSLTAGDGVTGHTLTINSGSGVDLNSDSVSNFAFVGNVDLGANTIKIASGTVQFGNYYQSGNSHTKNTLAAQKLVVENGAVFKIYHQDDTNGGVSSYINLAEGIELKGGTILTQATGDGGANNGMHMGALTVSGEGVTSTLAHRWGTKLMFTELSGDGNLTANANTGNARYYIFDTIKNFSGTYTESSTDGNNKTYINSVHQDSAYSGTVSGLTYSDAEFKKTGEGSISFENHTASADFTVQAGTVSATTLTTSGDSHLSVSGGKLTVGAYTSNGSTSVSGGEMSATTMATGENLSLSGGTLAVGTLTLNNAKTLSLTGGSFGVANELSTAWDVTLGNVTLGTSITSGETTTNYNAAITLSGAVEFVGAVTNATTLHLTGSINVTSEALDTLVAASVNRTNSYSDGDNGYISGTYTLITGAEGSSLDFGTDAETSAAITSKEITVAGSTTTLTATAGSASFELVGSSGTYYINVNTSEDGTHTAYDADGAMAGATSLYVTNGSTLKFSSKDWTENFDLANGTVIFDGGSADASKTITLHSSDADGDGVISAEERSSNVFSMGNSTLTATISGTGDLTLSKSNDYAFNLNGTIEHQGNLTIAGAITAASHWNGAITPTLLINNEGTVTLANGATFNVNSGTTFGENVTGINMQGAVLNLGGSQLESTPIAITLSGDSNTIKSSGNISSAISGASNLTLEGVFHYKGEMSHTGNLTIKADVADEGATLRTIDINGATLNNTGTITVEQGRVAIWNSASVGSNVTQLLVTGGKLEIEGRNGYSPAGAISAQSFAMTGGEAVIGTNLNLTGTAADTLKLTGGTLTAQQDITLGYNATLGGVTLTGDTYTVQEATGNQVVTGQDDEGNDIYGDEMVDVTKYHSLTIGAEGTTTSFTGAVTNNGNLTLNGSLKLNTLDGLTKTAYTRAEGENGYNYDAYTLVNGAEGSSLTLGSNKLQIALDGYTDATLTANGGSASFNVASETTYHVAKDTVAYSDITNGAHGKGFDSIALEGGTLAVGEGVVSQAITVSKESFITGTPTSGGSHAGIANGITGTADVTITVDGGTASGGEHGTFFALSGAVDLGSNDLIVDGGVLRLGNLNQDTNSDAYGFTAGNIVVKSGATLEIFRDGGTLNTGLTLSGGTLHIQQVKAGGTGNLSFGTLTVNGETASSITSADWGEGVQFASMTGAGDITFNSSRTITIGKLEDYTGTLTLSKGELNFSDNLTVSGNSVQVNGGTLNVSGALTIGADGSLTTQTGSTTSVEQLAVTAGNFTYNGGSISINGESNKMSFTGGTVQATASGLTLSGDMTVGAVTFVSSATGNAITLGDANNALSTTFVGTVTNQAELTLRGSLVVSDISQLDKDGVSIAYGQTGYNYGTYYLVKADATGAVTPTLSLTDTTVDITNGASDVNITVQDGSAYFITADTTYHIGSDETGLAGVAYSTITGIEGVTFSTIALDGGVLNIEAKQVVDKAISVTANSGISGAAAADGTHAGITGSITASGEGADLTITSAARTPSDNGAHGNFFALAGDINLGSGSLIIDEGVVRLGNTFTTDTADKSSVDNAAAITAGQIVVNDGATLEIYRNGADLTSVGVTLAGGTLRVQQVNSAKDPNLDFGVLTLTENTDSVIDRNSWGKSVTFTSLTGAGNLELTNNGTTTIGAYGDYTGNLKVSGGTLNITNALLLDSGTLTLAGGTTNASAGFELTTGGTLVLAGGALNAPLTLSGGTLTAAKDDTFNSNITLGGVRVVSNTHEVTNEETQEVSTVPYTLTLGGEDKTLTFTGTVTNAAHLTLNGAIEVADLDNLKNESVTIAAGQTGYNHGTYYLVEADATAGLTPTLSMGSSTVTLADDSTAAITVSGGSATFGYADTTYHIGSDETGLAGVAYSTITGIEGVTFSTIALDGGVLNAAGDVTQNITVTTASGITATADATLSGEIKAEGSETNRSLTLDGTAGALSITGTLIAVDSLTTTGTVNLFSNVSLTGEQSSITVSSGKLMFGDSGDGKATSTLGVSNIIVANGAEFRVARQASEVAGEAFTSAPNLELQGGTLHMQAMDGSSDTSGLVFGTLSVTGETASYINSTWAHTTFFNKMTGSGDLNITKSEESYLWGRSILMGFNSIEDYTGTVSVADQSDLQLFLININQGEDKSGTVNGTTYSSLASGLTMNGLGSMTLENHKASGAVTVNSGMLNVGALTAAGDVTVKEGGSLNVGTFTTAGALTLTTAADTTIAINTEAVFNNTATLAGAGTLLLGGDLSVGDVTSLDHVNDALEGNGFAESRYYLVKAAEGSTATISIGEQRASVQATIAGFDNPQTIVLEGGNAYFGSYDTVYQVNTGTVAYSGENSITAKAEELGITTSGISLADGTGLSIAGQAVEMGTQEYNTATASGTYDTVDADIVVKGTATISGGVNSILNSDITMEGEGSTLTISSGVTEQYYEGLLTSAYLQTGSTDGTRPAFALRGDIDLGSNDLAITDGWVAFGKHGDTGHSTNTIKANSLTIGSGATMEIYHAGENGGQNDYFQVTNGVTLDGGRIFVRAIDAASGEDMNLGKLTVASASSIGFYWGGQLIFDDMAGTGALTIMGPDGTITGDGTHGVTFKDVTDYSGKLTVSKNETGIAGANVTIEKGAFKGDVEVLNGTLTYESGASLAGTQSVSVSGGKLVLASDVVYATKDGAAAPTVAVSGDGTLELETGNYDSGNRLSLQMDGGKLAMSDATLKGSIELNDADGSDETVLSGSGALRADISGTGNLKVDASGNYYLYHADGDGNDASLNYDGNFTKTGDGTVYLGYGSSAANLSGSGQVSVEQGTLQLVEGSVSKTGGVTVAADAELKIEAGASIDPVSNVSIAAKQGSTASFVGGTINSTGITGGELKNAEMAISQDYALNGVKLEDCHFSVNAALKMGETSAVNVVNSSMDIGVAGTLDGGALSLENVMGALTLSSTENGGLATVGTGGNNNLVATFTTEQLAGTISAGSTGSFTLDLAAADLTALVGDGGGSFQIVLSGLKIELPSQAQTFSGLEGGSVESLGYSLGNISFSAGTGLANAGYSVSSVASSSDGESVVVTLNYQMIPEPTTATLSLLALAALAARRRRK